MCVFDLVSGILNLLRDDRFFCLWQCSNQPHHHEISLIWLLANGKNYIWSCKVWDNNNKTYNMHIRNGETKITLKKQNAERTKGRKKWRFHSRHHKNTHNTIHTQVHNYTLYFEWIFEKKIETHFLAQKRPKCTTNHIAAHSK